MSTNGTTTDKGRYQRYLASREWGLLKKQVKTRSGGICERCKTNPSRAVHHITYERVYHELLEDLLDVCEACHEFLGGHSDEDPLADTPVVFGGHIVKRVYLAGRISHGHGNWRASIVPGWNVGGGATWWEEKGHKGKWASGRVFAYEGEWDYDDISEFALLPDGRKLTYVGPWWLDLYGGHGGGFGPHAMGNQIDDPSDQEHTRFALENRGKLLEFIRTAIAHSQLLFAWVDSREAIGTIAEITMAYMWGIPVVIATPSQDRELWMPFSMASVFIVAKTAGEAWERLWTGDDASSAVSEVEPPIDVYEEEPPIPVPSTNQETN